MSDFRELKERKDSLPEVFKRLWKDAEERLQKRENGLIIPIPPDCEKRLAKKYVSLLRLTAVFRKQQPDRTSLGYTINLAQLEEYIRKSFFNAFDEYFLKQ